MVVPAQTPNTPQPVEAEGAKPPEAGNTVEQAKEEIRQLELEQQERADGQSGTVPGIGAGQPPPRKQAQDDDQTTQSQQSQQVQQQDLASVFAQMISVGYKPSNQALGNAAHKANSGPHDLSGTWLSNLFIKLLRSENNSKSA